MSYYYNASLGGVSGYDVEILLLSAGKIRTWWGDIPFLPVDKPRPALRSRIRQRARWWLLRATRALQAVRQGSCQQPNIDRDGMPARSWPYHVRSEMSRVHRGSRTERREFASLEPLKGADQRVLIELKAAATR